MVNNQVLAVIQQMQRQQCTAEDIITEVSKIARQQETIGVSCTFCPFANTNPEPFLPQQTPEEKEAEKAYAKLDKMEAN